ncbi:SNF2 family N-terminal domain-containing protein [Biscogniauxia mediterranea]|nr:SNF2 family N-terminal domain-containing protein [Biscogniauxia mediterranea]
MRKPGDHFGFQPTDNLASKKTPSFHKHKKNKPVAMVREQAPPKAPLRPLGLGETNGSASTSNGNSSVLESDKSRYSIASSTDSTVSSHSRSSTAYSAPAPAHAPAPRPRPAVKASAFSGSNMDDKYANLFIQPKNRPEHHRPQRITGPLQPTYKDRKPAPAPMFNTIPGAEGSASNPISVPDGGGPVSIYSQPGVFSEYVDPKKAAADIKALLEGSLEDDEDKDKAEDISEDKSMVEGLKVRLLPHQVEGVEWMKNRELGPVKKGKVPKGGLLADDMGLGKTLQSIALILSNAKPQDKHPGVEKTTLVVAPLALIRQWEAELKDKVTDSHRLKVLVHHGPQRTKRFEDLRRYDVVITTYQILVSEHNHSNDKLKAGCFGLHWYRVILDEAHTIKNRNAKATKACYELRSIYRWCLSGTPMQNNLDELQSLVKFLRIKPYDDLREWRDHFDLPMKNGKGHIAMQRLRSVLACFMKRRTKDILKEAGALNTGGKEAKDGEERPKANFKITERKVVSIATEFSPAEKRFYDRLEQRTDKSLEAMMRNKINYASALVLLLRLRQACNHPKLVEGKLEKDKDALSEETTRPKKADADIDALADLLGGLDVETKHCEICGFELDKKNRQPKTDKCKDCFADLEYFKHHEEGGDLKAPKTRTKKKPKAKVTKVVKEKVEKKVVSKRKPRNRRAILDSDDEEADGSWIVSGDEQGSLRLGKAGGTDDENAEGDGETINSEDSENSEEDEVSQISSRLDSFIVDDGSDTKSDDIRRALEESDSDESLESLSAIQSKTTRKSARPSAVSDEGDDDDDTNAGSEEEDDDDDEDSEDDDTGISESELHDSESEDDDSNYGRRRGGSKEKTPHVLASAKIRQLISILRKEVHEHKFIVFSQFTSMLDLVEPFLRKEGIKYARYDGGMRNDAREAALDSLRNDGRTRALLCSLRCGALGLNLTAASRVVILEPFWNPFVEEQAIDRVHRLTQTVDVVVYKLTVEGSVEERILELQDKKRMLAAEAIESGANRKDALKLGLKEMLELFRHVGKRQSGGDDGEEGEEGDGDNDDRVIKDDVLQSMRSGGRKGKQKKTSGGGSAGRDGESSIYGRRW